MNRNSSKFLQILVSLFLMNIMYTLYGFGQTAYEGYYLRSTNYPSYGNLWTLNGLADGEAQGVTHDNDNWYFTWTYNNVGYLIKVPVNVPLSNDVLLNPNVIQRKSENYPELAGYWHWGDPDHYRYSGTDYIVIPIGTGTPRIAIFRGNMTLAAYGILSYQQSTGWCAVHPQTGELYTSEDFDYSPPVPDCDDQSHHFLYPRTLLRYSIPWSMLPNSDYINITLAYNGYVEMFTSSGGQMELYNMQGGEFTPSGELLYISAGSGCCNYLDLGGGHGQLYAIDGLYTFDTKTWRTVKRSYNHTPSYPNTSIPKYFDYFYPFGCGGGNCSEGGEMASWSPEGLTIWDLDDGRDPNISGQLHVLLFKYRARGHNRQVFEHFGGRLYVDQSTGVDQILFPCVNSGPTDDSPLRGCLSSPFKTFGYAYNGYPVWDGAEIVLKAGSYSGVGVYSKKVRLVSRGGSAIIGK